MLDIIGTPLFVGYLNMFHVRVQHRGLPFKRLMRYIFSLWTWGDVVGVEGLEHVRREILNNGRLCQV